MRAHRAFTLVNCLGGIERFEEPTDEKKGKNNTISTKHRNE